MPGQKKSENHHHRQTSMLQNHGVKKPGMSTVQRCTSGVNQTSVSGTVSTAVRAKKASNVVILCSSSQYLVWFCSFNRHPSKENATWKASMEKQMPLLQNDVIGTAMVSTLLETSEPE
jgi:hypothetical protein